MHFHERWVRDGFSFPFVSRAQNRQVKLRGRVILLAQSSPHRHRLRHLTRLTDWLCRSTDLVSLLTCICRHSPSPGQPRTRPSSQSLLFYQSPSNHPPPCIPFSSLLTLFCFPLPYPNPTFKRCLWTMTSMAPTKTQLLARWRGIEEVDDTSRDSHLQPHRFQLLKEEWSVFASHPSAQLYPF